MRIVMLLLSLVGLGAAPESLAWWNDDWSFRKEITFDLSPAGADVAGSPAEVPVLIRLSLGNFEYFADAKPDGSDFRFIAADDKTPLKHHVEKFDPQSQMALVWVRLPRLTAGATTDKVFLYYGNPEATDAADPAGSYDTPQALVYHFGPAAGQPQDATGYKSEPSALAGEITPASLIGAGVKLGGAQVISIPATGAIRLVLDKGLSISAWVRIEAPQSQALVFQLSDQGKELALGIDGTKPFLRFVAASGAAPVPVTAAADLVPGQWHHLALRAAEGRIAVFLDGVDVGNAPASLVEIGGVLTVGGSVAQSNYLAGDLDELQVSAPARGSDWLRAAARSQGVVAPLVVYGGDAQKEGGGEGYFATTMRNVTVDGWVVIGICALLFLFSVAIMIAKVFHLNRVVKGNQQFMAEFEKLGDDLAALESPRGGAAAVAAPGDGPYGTSTLYRLYHHGVGEAHKRLAVPAADADRVRTLSPQSIEAIRASMDASLTRLTQRLGEQMVWLTISISGGPFLGLLGTVVGVMITFAAIAASGDVNVNAIAPGIAAALVATVAGLGVAIPCLFGYNYLNTRIKEINADMRVFVDEFVARLAETYS
jgi:biopolymer transport protein ExbB